MHNEDIERIAPEESEPDREALTAADDTGLLSQQIEIVSESIDEAESGDAP